MLCWIVTRMKTDASRKYPGRVVINIIYSSNIYSSA